MIASSFCWQALVLALKDFVAAQGMQDVVPALDGTLSAAVLATLASDALGPMHVHALLAPLEVCLPCVVAVKGFSCSSAFSSSKSAGYASTCRKFAY